MAAQAASTAAARSTDTNVVIIGRARWVSPSQTSGGIFEPDANGKRGCALLIPEAFDLSNLKAAVKSAAVKTFGSDPAKHVGARNPIGLAAEKGTFAGYEPGVTLIRASTKRVPTIVDAAGKAVNPAVLDTELYDGRWVEMHVNPYGYNMSGNKGVAFGLNGIQLLDHADPLGRSNTSAFGVYKAAVPAMSAAPAEQSAWD
ncbi:DUF2815 family protein [Roseicella sp. DB1501]|nr:DUF2815 family protein [Roseicella sp. DB1501]